MAVQQRNSRDAMAEYHHDISALSADVDNLKTAVSRISKKLDDLTTAIGSHRSFDVKSILTITALVVSLLGALVTFTTYVSSATNASAIAITKFKTDEMWQTGRWVPNRNTSIIAKRGGMTAQ